MSKPLTIEEEWADLMSKIPTKHLGGPEMVALMKMCFMGGAACIFNNFLVDIPEMSEEEGKLLLFKIGKELATHGTGGKAKAFENALKKAGQG